ncbi:MAG: phosphodiester glycosidase family protein, partial [Treponema sp.]|nr:phosphodiester glycosidase family protein [Treponema sp.]
AGLLAAINALPFDPSSDREGEPRANVGVVISDGRMLSTPRARYDALVFFADGGAAIVSQAEIQGERLEQISNAVGGFYRLLSGGEPVARVLGLQARHPRSAAGISACGRYLYLLAIDGRRPGSQGATELETALLLRALGAAEGINFDGGGSTALALRHPDGQTRLANVPVHSGVPGRERAVAGLLGIAYR